MALPFTKVEGLGNDFVVVDLRPGRPAAASGGPSPEDPAVGRAICAPRFRGRGAGGRAAPAAQAGAARVRTFQFTAVLMGNPHAVIFFDDGDAASLRTLAEEFGPLFETAERFPNRTNVEFAHVRPSGEIDLVVWERGSGITLACGTG